MPDLAALVGDLRAGTVALDDVIDRHVREEGIEALDRATPAEGWTVADTLAHLAGFDDAAVRALSDPDGFAAEVEAAVAGTTSPIEAVTDRGRLLGPTGSLEWWRSARRALLTAVADRDGRDRVPWYGPSMSLMSFLTARLMETWAHGQDIRDTWDEPSEVTTRLRHVAHLGVAARPFSYLGRGLEVPGEPVAVSLEGPGGEVWRWGPEESAQRVEGPALDFCLVVTQRRHLDDTDLVVVGPVAAEWMRIAQAFAGPPGPGRDPGSQVRGQGPGGRPG